jgi:hypothetical protein
MIYLILVVSSFSSEVDCAAAQSEIRTQFEDEIFSCADGSLAPTETLRPIARSTAP